MTPLSQPKYPEKSNMKLLFLLPDIQDIPTGGNIYNTRMMEALKAKCTVHQLVYAERHNPEGSITALIRDCAACAARRHPHCLRSVRG